MMKLLLHFLNRISRLALGTIPSLIWYKGAFVKVLGQYGTSRHGA